MKQNELLWLVGGVGIGAGCVYLFATRDGRRLQRRLRRRGVQLVETSQKWVDTGKEAVDRGMELVNDAGDFLTSKIRASNV